MLLDLETKLHDIVITREGEDPATFSVAPLSPHDREKIKNSHRVPKVVQGVVDYIPDESEIRLHMMRKIIKGWNIRWPDGSAIELNEINRKKLHDTNLGIVSELLNRENLIAAGIMEVEIAERKNSLSGYGGTTPQDESPATTETQKTTLTV